MINPHKRLLNFMAAIGSRHDEKIGRNFFRYSDLVSYIYEKNRAGVELTVTDIIYKDDMVSSKSIYNKIRELNDLGYLEFRYGKDRRVRIVSLTCKGAELFDSFAFAFQLAADSEN